MYYVNSDKGRPVEVQTLLEVSNTDAVFSGLGDLPCIGIDAYRYSG